MLLLSGRPYKISKISNPIFSILCSGFQKTLCIVFHYHRTSASTAFHFDIDITRNIIKHPLITLSATNDNSCICALHSVHTSLPQNVCSVLERKGKSPFQVSAGSSDASLYAPTNADLKAIFLFLISLICSLYEHYTEHTFDFQVFF